jgi:putative phosphoribosyl transferase
MLADRQEAGRRLAEKLVALVTAETVVIALPRGGVPVAFEVARVFHLPLDLMPVRKVGLPGHDELAVAAISGRDGAVMVVNDEIAAAAKLRREDIQRLAEPERKELRRRVALYQGGRPAADLEGKTVIVVDDGMATGATMKAALTAVRAAQPARVILAVPVAPEDMLAEMQPLADTIVCLENPHPFIAVGAHYRSFGQVDDASVIALLDRAANPPTL